MGLLYQDIMNVPGLTGTWKERANQYMKALTGKKYDGSRDTGLYLLSQMSKKNYPQVQETEAAPVKKTQPTLAMQYTDPLTGQLESASEIPQFQNLVGDYEQLWTDRFAPGVQQAAESQINPEAMRQYNTQYRDYMNQLTSSGGQRMGRGLAGIGSLKAGAERSRLSTLQDWMGQQKSGIQSLWYDPTAESWNKARTQMQAGDEMPDYTIPTADEALEQYGAAYGTGASSSPFYG